MKRSGTSLFLGSFIGALATLILIGGFWFLNSLPFYVHKVFPLASLSTIFSIISLQLIVGIYFALPVTGFVFAGILYHKPVIDFQLARGWRIGACIFTTIVCFIWAAYIHPHFNRQLAVVVYDVQNRVSPENFGKSDSLVNAPDLLNYSQLDALSFESLHGTFRIRDELIEKIGAVMTSAQVDTLLTDSTAKWLGLTKSDFHSIIWPSSITGSYRQHLYLLQNARREIRTNNINYNRSQWLKLKMTLYPLTACIFLLIGFTMGRLLRMTALWMIMLIAWCVVFPLFLYGGNAADTLVEMKKLHYSISPWILPVFFLLIWISLLIMRRKRLRYSLDLEFIEKHRHELDRFDQLRKSDDYVT